MEASTPNEPRSAARTYECSSCHHIETRTGFCPAQNVETRIDPGGTYTDKECPRCGALAYPANEDGPETDLASMTTEDVEIGEHDFIVGRLEVHEQPVLIRADEAGGPREAARIVQDGGGTVLFGTMTFHTNLREYGGVDVYHNVEQNGRLVANVEV